MLSTTFFGFQNTARTTNKIAFWKKQNSFKGWRNYRKSTLVL